MRALLVMADVEPPPDAPLPALAVAPLADYTTLPVQQLIEAVQRVSEDRTAPSAQGVFAALHQRYYPYLFKVVLNGLGFRPRDPHGVQEIVNDALAAFFRACGKFRFDRNAATEQDRHQQVCSYLGQLAKWKIRNSRSFQKSFGASVLDLEELERRMMEVAQFSLSPEEAEGPAKDPRIDRATAWLDAKSEIEGDVIRTYYLDDHLGQKSSRMPGGIAQRLAEKHGVTTSNIRHLKRKLLREMRELLAPR